jgi:hypothetical protein
MSGEARRQLLGLDCSSVVTVAESATLSVTTTGDAQLTVTLGRLPAMPVERSMPSLRTSTKKG